MAQAGDSGNKTITGGVAQTLQGRADGEYDNDVHIKPKSDGMLWEEVVDAEEREKQKENLENQKRDEERREKQEEKENSKEKDNFI